MMTNRNAAQYMTVLSAVSDEAGGRQAVNGYHAVQFGQDGTAALDEQTVLDGVYLEDGLATASSGSGSFNTPWWRCRCAERGTHT